MKLSAVLLARYVGILETPELDARGRLYFPDLLKAVVSRFGFLKYPTTVEEMDSQKGVEFYDGKWADIVVNKLILYTTGLTVETRSSTADGEKVVDESLKWAAGEFKLNYASSMIKRKAYVSNLLVHSEVPLLTILNKALATLSDRVGRSFVSVTGSEHKFEPIAFAINSETAFFSKAPQAAFTIQRRIDTPFSENKYFSEAPLPTDVHYKLLEAFEADLLSRVVEAKAKE